MLVLTLGVAAGSLVVGFLVGRVDTRVLVAGGLVAYALGFGLFSHMGPSLPVFWSGWRASPS